MPSYEEVRYHFNHHDPFARHMGIELLEVGPEHGVAIMPLDERHRNGMGHAHGGAIFALVDMTFATVSKPPGSIASTPRRTFHSSRGASASARRSPQDPLRPNLGTYDPHHRSDGTLVAIATVTGFMTKYPIQPKDA
ncbi:MAG: PaaI family thioesterase [Bilophila wadsworthia]